ncbi:hypothetical protein [Clostridium tarantellae]|nr:hypothetical protein [Clostridium tarantellae]
MTKKHCYEKHNNHTNKLDPTSSNYAEKIKNKANESTPQEESRPTKHI